MLYGCYSIGGRYIGPWVKSLPVVFWQGESIGHRNGLFCFIPLWLQTANGGGGCLRNCVRNCAHTSRVQDKENGRVGGNPTQDPSVPRVLPHKPITLAKFKTIVADPSIPDTLKHPIALEVVNGWLSSSNISFIVNCMKKGQYMNIALLEDLAKRVLRFNHILTNFTPVQMSVVIHSLAVLSTRTSQFFCSFEELLRTLVWESIKREKLGRLLFDEQSIANVVYGLGMVFNRQGGGLDDHMRKVFLDTVLEKLTKEENGVSRMAKCSEHDLASILYWLAVIGYENDKVLGALLQELSKQSRLENLTEQALVSFVDGLRALQNSNNDKSKLGGSVCKDQKVSDTTNGLNGPMHGKCGVLAVMGNEIQKPHRLANFDEHQLANLVFALSRLHYFDKGLLEGLGREIIKPGRLKRFHEQHLSNIMYGFGKLQFYKPHILNPVINEITLPHRLNALSPPILISTLYRLARVDFCNREVLEALGGELKRPGRLELVDEQGLSIIAYAFSRLQHYDEGVLDALGGEITKPDRLLACNQDSLSIIVFGLAMLNYTNDGVMHALGEELRKPHRLSACRGQNLANILYGFAKLDSANEGVLEAVCGELSKPDRLKPVNAQGLVNILRWLTALNYQSEELLDNLAQEIKLPWRLAAFIVQDLANIVCWLSKLNYDNKEVLDSLGQEITRPKRLEAFSAQELSVLLSGFGKLLYQDEGVLDAISSEIKKPRRLVQMNEQALSVTVNSLGKLGHCNVELMDALGQEVTKRARLSAFNEQNLANIVYGFSKLQYGDERVLGELSEEIRKPHRLAAFNEQNLSNIVYGFGLLKYFDEVALEAISKELIESTRMGAYQEQALSNIIYGLALLSDHFTQEFSATVVAPILDCFTEEVLSPRRIKVFSQQGLAMVGWGVAKMRYLNARLMDALVERLLEYAKAGEIESRHTSMLLHACSLLNHRHEGFVEYLNGQIDGKWDEDIEARHLVSTMWGLAILGHLTPELFQKLCLEVMEMGLGDMGVGMHQQILQAFMYVTSLGNVEIDGEVRGLVDNGKEICKSGHGAAKSNFEREVSHVLDALGIEHVLHYEMPEGIVVVDMLLVGGGPQIVIEVDGPCHYTVNKWNGEFREQGTTVLRNRILEQLGYKVLCVPYFSWELMRFEERKAWIEQAIQELQC